MSCVIRFFQENTRIVDLANEGDDLDEKLRLLRGDLAARLGENPAETIQRDMSEALVD